MNIRKKYYLYINTYDLTLLFSILFKFYLHNVDLENILIKFLGIKLILNY